MPTLTQWTSAPAARAAPQVLLFYQQVREACLDRLRDALNPDTALFDRQLRERRWDRTWGTEDVTSTAICLIGVHRAGVDPARVGLAPERTLEALAGQARRRRYLGGHGLVLWAHAAWDREPTHRLEARLGLSPTDAGAWLPRMTTMETAWFVSGLAHETMRRGGRARDALAAGARELLARFDTRARLFRHATPAAPLAHRLRRWVANFADQIYAVQALSFAASVLGDEGPLRAADACASKLVELQGPLGQWPWHYDLRTGTVAQLYPVYAVHQYGMAPMALMAAEAAGATPRPGPVERSIAWIADNERRATMLDARAGTIWRDLEPDQGRAARWLRRARLVCRWRPPSTVPPARLIVNYETRPYEWAWCLYAGAVAAGGPASGHLVEAATR